MAGITHSTPADGTFSASGSTAWDASHDIAAGTITEAMQVLADNTTNNASTSAHGYLLKLSNVATEFMNGQGAWATPAGGASLNGITAATGAVTIASGNNTGIVWNWANTTDSTVAFRLGETTAATNGTSTSGVPNQVLFRLDTVAASTQSPLSVFSRAAHVFSVSPTAAQVLFANGNFATPTISNAAGNSGLVLTTAIFAVSISGVENCRFIGAAGSNTLQLTNSTAVTTAYALNFQKSRGTVAAPTVITTGDDLATISGFGYVGATGTYVEACRITFDSTGTIANTTSGTGGVIRFGHAIVGTVGATEVAKFHSQHLIHEGSSPTITADGGTNPSIVGKDEACVVTIGTGGVATSVTVTFANAFTTNPPVCVAQSDTDIVAFKVVSTTTTVKVDAAAPFTAGSKITIVSRGWE